MPLRLHPLTADPRVLELLAGVPSGTNGRLLHLVTAVERHIRLYLRADGGPLDPVVAKSLAESPTASRIRDTILDGVSNPAVSALLRLKSHGFGPLTTDLFESLVDLDFITADGTIHVPHITDPESMHLVLHLQGIYHAITPILSLRDLEGLTWR